MARNKVKLGIGLTLRTSRSPPLRFMASLARILDGLHPDLTIAYRRSAKRDGVTTPRIRHGQLEGEIIWKTSSVVMVVDHEIARQTSYKPRRVANVHFGKGQGLSKEIDSDCVQAMKI